MNASAGINQTHDAKAINFRPNVFGLRRRAVAGAALVMGVAASAVAFAATSHADVGTPPPNPGITVTAPSPAAPWLSVIDGYGGYGSYRHVHCGFPGWTGPYQCWSS